MKARRIERRSVPQVDFGDGLHPLLQRLYAARGVTDQAALDLALTTLEDYRKLGGMDAAVTLLAGALQAQQRILVVGDFDCQLRNL